VSGLSLEEREIFEQGPIGIMEVHGSGRHPPENARLGCLHLLNKDNGVTPCALKPLRRRQHVVHRPASNAKVRMKAHG